MSWRVEGLWVVRWFSYQSVKQGVSSAELTLDESDADILPYVVSEDDPIFMVQLKAYPYGYRNEREQEIEAEAMSRLNDLTDSSYNQASKMATSMVHWIIDLLREERFK